MGTGRGLFSAGQGAGNYRQRLSLDRERWLAWLDVIEAVIWLLIMVLIELTIRLQDRGISSGRAITTFNYLKFAGYSARCWVWRFIGALTDLIPELLG